jgi:fucose permease
VFIVAACTLGIAKSSGILIAEMRDYFDVSTADAALFIGVGFGIYTVLSMYSNIYIYIY